MADYELSTVPITSELAISETLLHPPQGFLRLHHFTSALDTFYWRYWGFLSAFASALYGLKSPDPDIIEEAERWYERLQQNPRELDTGEAHYMHDVYSGKGKADIEKQIRAEMHYALYLSSLPDDAVIKLGLGTDVICDGCSIGKHCTVANAHRYLVEPDPEVNGDAIQNEVRPVRHILMYLEQFPPDQLVEGRDWAIGMEQVQLVEEGGEFVTADAPYILMTMHVARRVMEAATRTPMG